MKQMLKESFLWCCLHVTNGITYSLVVQKPMPDSGRLTGSWEYGDCITYFDARAAAAITGMHLHCVATESLDEQREIIAAVLKLW